MNLGFWQLVIGQNFLVKISIIFYFQLIVMTIFHARVNSQSTCNFMSEIPNLKLKGIPQEPEFRKFVDSSNSTNHQIGYCNSVLRPDSRTCCTLSIESQMEKLSRTELQQDVQNQIVLLKEFFELYSVIFQKHVQTALQLTQRQLGELFTKTYGPYYTINSQIFDRFFAKLSEHFKPSRHTRNTTNVNNLTNELFQEIYVAEYLLFNPLAKLQVSKRKCLIEMQAVLKPFGSLPNKISLVLNRSLNAWKYILYSFKETATELETIAKQVELTPECSKWLMEMSRCHICAGKNPFLRPCVGFCFSVFKGCFREMAELNSPFNSFINSLFQLSTRLKNVYNPYNVLAPIPVQISEAIMNFQEKSIPFSNRIQLRCFQPEFRFKRSLPLNHQSTNENFISLSEDESAEKNVEIGEWQSYYYKSTVMSKLLHSAVADFIDKLIRSKNFWISIPRTLCEKTEFAAKRYEKCWNGLSDSNKRLRTHDSRESHIINKDAFVPQRLKFVTFAVYLNAHYEDREITNEELVEASAEEFLVSEDDEDSKIEGSGLYESSDDELTFLELDPQNDYNEFLNNNNNNNNNKNSTQQQQKLFGKLFTSFRHPTTNLSVIVTRNLPSFAGANSKRQSSWTTFFSGIILILLTFFF